MIRIKKEYKWLENIELQFLMRLFNAKVVGGAIRNSLLNLPLKDELDLATTCAPDQMMSIADKFKLRHIPTGIEHGTITILGKKFDDEYYDYLLKLLPSLNDQENTACEFLLNNFKHFQSEDFYELTTLRVDVETDGRHAKVEFTDNWKEDAARRDFTINALYIDYEGYIYDYFSGLDDIKKNLVRFVGNPNLRIQEDYLRILRFFRFSAYYGEGQFDSVALDACRDNLEGLKRVSGERFYKELFKTLYAPYVWESIKHMEDIGIFDILSWPKPNWKKIELYSQRASKDKISNLGMFALFDGEWNMLAMSRKDSIFIKTLQNEKCESDFDWFRCIYVYGLDWVKDKILLDSVNDRSFLNRCDLNAKFELKGGDLISVAKGLGIELEGRNVGIVHKQILHWWIEKGFYPNKEECELKAKEILADFIKNAK